MPAIGNVYYFNSTPNAALLLLNNAILNSSLAGVAQATSYVPAYGSAARNPASSSNNATFGQSNTLVVSFPNGGSQTYPVNIDPNQIQINNDLQIYIFFNEVVIVTPTGEAGQSAMASVVKGHALSHEQERHLTKLASTHKSAT